MINGNKILDLQVKIVTKNSLGEQIESWEDVQSIKGFLDLMSNQENVSTHLAGIIESSHVFICDYVPVPYDVEMLRAVCDDKIYDVTYIDNPMELNKHLEIFLDYLGGQ